MVLQIKLHRRCAKSCTQCTVLRRVFKLMPSDKSNVEYKSSNSYTSEHNSSIDKFSSVFLYLRPNPRNHVKF